MPFKDLFDVFGFFVLIGFIFIFLVFYENSGE